jgi:hypothetical protein
LNEFESAYYDDDFVDDDGRIEGIMFDGDDINVPQDALPIELTFSWETLPQDFQRPHDVPEPQYYNGETGLKRGIANTFDTPFGCLKRVGGADEAFWRRVTANSNKYARRNLTIGVNGLPYFAGSQWTDITVQEMIRAHGIMLRISCEPRALGGYHSYFCQSDLSFQVSENRHIQCPGFNGWAANYMSKRRFKQVCAAMHPEDIRKDDDKCYQIRHALRVLNQ